MSGPDVDDRESYMSLWRLLIDFKYIARQENISEVLNYTDFIE
jgi:hypothetical protein